MCRFPSAQPVGYLQVVVRGMVTCSYGNRTRADNCSLYLQQAACICLLFCAPWFEHASCRICRSPSAERNQSQCWRLSVLKLELGCAHWRNLLFDLHLATTLLYFPCNLWTRQGL